MGCVHNPGETVKVFLTFKVKNIIGFCLLEHKNSMPSRRYQKTLDRHQGMILPPSVDEYISQNNMVRAIDAYVDTLDLLALGFSNTQPITGAGQPAYDPAALMRLYLIRLYSGYSKVMRVKVVSTLRKD